MTKYNIDKHIAYDNFQSELIIRSTVYMYIYWMSRIFRESNYSI